MDGSRMFSIPVDLISHTERFAITIDGNVVPVPVGADAPAWSGVKLVSDGSYLPQEVLERWLAERDVGDIVTLDKSDPPEAAIEHISLADLDVLNGDADAGHDDSRAGCGDLTIAGRGGAASAAPEGHDA